MGVQPRPRRASRLEKSPAVRERRRAQAGAWLIPLLLPAFLALTPATAAAAAAPLSATFGIAAHRLSPPPGAARFWTPARVRRALGPAGTAPPGPRLLSLRVLEPTSPENRVNGRIFGVDPVEGPYSCSGTSLATPSGSVVLTAGHCVYEVGRWGRDLVFVPAYDHGRRPFGTFVATAVFATPQWQALENSDFDIAALRVRANATGTLARTVGARGWTTGRSRYGALQIFGYPAAALGGEELRSCVGRGLGGDRRSDAETGPPTMPAACNMAGGASGGAWLSDGLIDGVTSYGYPSQPDRLYSPYFGPGIGNFLAQLP